MSEPRILIRLLQMYFPRKWEFGLRNFGGGGGGPPNPPPPPPLPPRYATATELSQPTSSGVQFLSSNSRTLTPSSAKLTTASRWRTMRTSTTGALWPYRDIRGSLVTTGFH